jgi:fumarate reductase flavoprotein subunit
MNLITTDIVIVGAGGAGLRAAVAKTNPGLGVALLSEVHPMRSHAIAAEGGVAKDNDSLGDCRHFV